MTVLKVSWTSRKWKWLTGNRRNGKSEGASYPVDHVQQEPTPSHTLRVTA